MPKQGLLTGCCGTAPYKAPEMIDRARGYTEKVDIWSMGVTAYLILFGDFPYVPQRNRERYEDAILIGDPAPDYGSGEAQCHRPSREAIIFISCLLSRSVADRCTAEQALQLPFMLGRFQDCDDVTKQESSQSLKATIGKARQKTREFDAVAVDPTERRSIDEILEMLRGSGEDNTTPKVPLRLSFSDGAIESLAVSSFKLGSVAEEDACKIAGGKYFKSGSHCGTLTLTAKDFFNEPSESTDAGDSSESEDKLDEMPEFDTFCISSPLSQPGCYGGLPHQIGPNLYM